MHKFNRWLLFGALVSAPAAADFVRIEENAPSVTYTGSWTAYVGDRLSGGRLVAGGEGSTATITFTGTGLRWIEYFNKDVRGGANIYLDGALITTVPAREGGVIDVYGEKQVRYTITGLTDGNHVLTIEGTGADFGFSPAIALDAFYVERASSGPDTTPPEIAIRTPHQDATVVGRTGVYADVFDNEQVASVRYFVDDAEVYIETTQATTMLTLSYWWSTLGSTQPGFESPAFSDGPHVMHAVARDAEGNETRSAPITVFVDNSYPAVDLTAPSPGAEVTGVVTISANATGELAPSGVEFYATAIGGPWDGTTYYLGADTSTPYAITRDTSTVVSGRTFGVWARVRDMDGNSVDTSRHFVTVQH